MKVLEMARTSLKRAMRFSATALFTVGLALPQSAHADEPGPKPHNRAEAIEIIRNLRHIVTPNGIVKNLYRHRLGKYTAEKNGNQSLQ